MPYINRVLCMNLHIAGYVIACLDILVAMCVASMFLFYLALFLSLYDPKTYNRITPETKMLGFLCLMVGICVFDILLSIMLILGIKKNSQKMILAWIRIKAVGLVFLIPIVSMFFLGGVDLVARGELSAFIVNVLCPMIIIVLHCYSYVVIYSLYQCIRDGLQEHHPIDSE